MRTLGEPAVGRLLDEMTFLYHPPIETVRSLSPAVFFLYIPFHGIYNLSGRNFPVSEYMKQGERMPGTVKALVFLSSGLVLTVVVLILLTNIQYVVPLRASTGDTKVMKILADQCPVSDGLDFPVGPPDAKGYYDAQPFQKNYHLGEDWNGKGGGNTDLYDPVYSIADGIVVYAADAGGGWGNIVRIVHNIGTEASPVYIESLYGHLQNIDVELYQAVKRGKQIGTIGNLDGFYLAHLHFELRTNITIGNGFGYSANTSGYVAPTPFIQSHRPE